jgi:hypothetical protein
LILCTLGHHYHVLHVSMYYCGLAPHCARRRISLLLKSISVKKIANRTFSMGHHLRRTPMPVWTHAACSTGGAAWSTSYFQSLKPSDVSNHLCRRSVPLSVSEVGLIGRSLLWLLVATVLDDITECSPLLWPLVRMTLGDITECPSLLWP